MPEELKPGDEVLRSGIYKVVHDVEHREEHEVTCIIGEHFPACNHCGKHPRFMLVRAAHHFRNHKYFQK